MAMQTAKADGRRATRLYSADIGARAVERARLEIDLRDALAAGEFRLVYQPQFNMRTGAVVGAEALLRWRHPTRGEVPPQAFIPLTEETGLIVEIGGWVLRTACRQAMRWRAGAPPRVAVNISAVQLKRRDFVATVVGALDEAGLDPARLDLEITEGVLLAEGDGALAQLESLRKIGISLTLDDFGTGYSNLSYLTRFPIDRLKIDRSFVHGLPDEQSPTSVVAAVIGLSRGLNLDLVAEGVETAEQASCLMAAGCDKAQGFLLSRPLPPEEMAALVAAAEEGRHGAWYGLQD